MPYKTFPPIVAVKSSAPGALSCARASTAPLPPALPTEPASLGFGGGPIVGKWGAYPLIGLMPHKTFGFAGAPDITQMGRRSPPISRFLLRKNAWRRFAAARRCRADNPRRRKVRLSQLSPFWRKLRPLPCSSSSHCDRSAGSQREPLGKTFPPIRSVGEWGAYPLIGLSNGLYLAVLSLPFGES